MTIIWKDFSMHYPLSKRNRYPAWFDVEDILVGSRYRDDRGFGEKSTHYYSARVIFAIVGNWTARVLHINAAK